MTLPSETIVSAEWLKENIEQKNNICLLDASWHLPTFNRDAVKEYEEGHIDGARFFDIGKYKPKLPSSEEFTSDMTKLGVNASSHVVVYDSNPSFGLFSAPRAWWLLRTYGHGRVSILNGGLPRWKAIDGKLTEKVPAPGEGDFKAVFDGLRVKSLEQVEKNVADKEFVLIDTRPEPRFNGRSPEPRPDIKPGHIKDARNIPFTNCIDDDSKMLKSVPQLKQLFDGVDVDFKKPVVSTCGSGVSGCFVILAAHLNGHEIDLYEGAWVEFFTKGQDKLKVL